MTKSIRETATIRIEIVCAWPERVWQQTLHLPVGTTVAQALSASRWQEIEAELCEPPKIGIYGRLVTGSEKLAEGDRIELYRSLLADPKEARRRRASSRST